MNFASSVVVTVLVVCFVLALRSIIKSQNSALAGKGGCGCGSCGGSCSGCSGCHADSESVVMPTLPKEKKD